MSRLVVEDGSLVAGANSWVGLQEAAGFHVEHGGLLPVSEILSSSLTFAAGGVISGAGLFGAVQKNALVELRGTAEPGNSGFALVLAASADSLTLDVDWISTETEAAGAAVRITVYEQAGWWAATTARLVASLINAASFMANRYAWPGSLIEVGQALPWPRKYVYLYPAGPTFLSVAPLPDIGGVQVNPATIPIAVRRCQCWLSLADIESPLNASVDPQQYLVSKSIGVSGISKTFGGAIRRRRFPQADAELAQLLAAASSTGAGPFIPLLRV